MEGLHAEQVCGGWISTTMWAGFVCWSGDEEACTLSRSGVILTLTEESGRDGEVRETINKFGGEYCETKLVTSLVTEYKLLLAILIPVNSSK